MVDCRILIRISTWMTCGAGLWNPSHGTFIEYEWLTSTIVKIVPIVSVTIDTYLLPKGNFLKSVEYLSNSSLKSWYAFLILPGPVASSPDLWAAFSCEHVFNADRRRGATFFRWQGAPQVSPCGDRVASYGLQFVVGVLGTHETLETTLDCSTRQVCKFSTSLLHSSYFPRKPKVHAFSCIYLQQPFLRQQ